MIYRTLVFVIINFAALGIGSLLTNIDVSSEWYLNLNKAPWTPPGWAFGAMWSIVMICFSWYMAFAWEQVEDRLQLTGLFILQWFLIAFLNPLFFEFQAFLLGLIFVSALVMIVGHFLFNYWSQLKIKSLLLLPYFLWLLVAVSLNAYIYIKN